MSCHAEFIPTFFWPRLNNSVTLSSGDSKVIDSDLYMEWPLGCSIIFSLKLEKLSLSDKIFDTALSVGKYDMVDLDEYFDFVQSKKFKTKRII